MLEIASPSQNVYRNYGGSPAFETEVAKSGIDLAGIVGFFRRQWPLMAAVVGTILAIAIAYLLLAPPRYYASTLLMLDTRRAQVFQQQSVVGELTFDESAVASQVEILKSVNVARSVVSALKLADDPEFTGNVRSFFGSITSGIAGLFTSSFAPDLVLSQDELQRRAVGRLQDNLTVVRVGRTYVLEIGYKSYDRAKAATIANAFGDSYINDQLDAKYVATKRASTWLQERITDLREEATNSDRAVQNFKIENKFIDTGTGTRTVGEQQLGEINSQLVTARAAVAEAKARLDRILEINDAGALSATVADALKNDVISRLRTQWVDASKREAEFSSRYGANHQASINLRKDMDQIQRLTVEELHRIAETYRSDYEIAQSRERSLQANFDNLMRNAATSKQAEVALRVLESSAKSYRTLYDSFLNRFMEATQQQSFPNTEARVITPASSAEKYDPKTSTTLGVALVLGLFLGVGAAFAREQLDRVFRLPSHVESTLGLTCLGVLPEVDSLAATRKIAGLLEQVSSDGRPRQIVRSLGIGRYVVAEPFSRFAETLRSVKVSADTATPNGHIKIIGMVSAVPAEGKSTVSANLAELISQTGGRVLLIDGDLRNPSLTRLIAPEAKTGVLEVLDGTSSLEDSVWEDPLTGMLFLPAPLKKAIAHTSEIISSPPMERLLAHAREKFDYVIVDLPPMAPVVDARAAAHLMDGFLLVIEWGKTAPQIVSEALEGAEVVRERIIGAILNKANTALLKRLESYKGANYHKYYNNYQRG